MFSKQYQSAILIAKILDVDVLDVILNKHIIPDNKQSIVDFKLEQLQKGVPLDYLLEQIQILSLSLKVTPDTLIPREETEEWITRFKDLMKRQKHNLDLVVDLGSGSGIIGLSLADIYNQVWLVDISEKSLDVAFDNANDNGITNTRFLQCDGLDRTFERALSEDNPKSWNLIANLPYLPSQDKESAKEFKVFFEPEVSLYSGVDGLDLFRRVLTQIQDIELKPEITVWELDPRNILEAELLLQNIGYQTLIWQDKNGLNRVLIGYCLGYFD